MDTPSYWSVMRLTIHSLLGYPMKVAYHTVVHNQVGKQQQQQQFESKLALSFDLHMRGVQEHYRTWVRHIHARNSAEGSRPESKDPDAHNLDLFAARNCNLLMTAVGQIGQQNVQKWILSEPYLLDVLHVHQKSHSSHHEVAFAPNQGQSHSLERSTHHRLLEDIVHSEIDMVLFVGNHIALGGKNKEHVSPTVDHLAPVIDESAD